MSHRTNKEYMETVCCVCSKKLGFIAKRRTCKRCELPVCKKHSEMRSPQERICESCKREEIHSKTYLVDSPEREQLTKEYQRLLKETSKKAASVKNLDTQISSYQSQLIFKTRASEEFLFNLKEKVENQVQQNKLESEQLANLKDLLVKTQQNEAVQKHKVLSNIEKVTQETKLKEILSEEVQAYEEQLKDLSEFAEGKIELSVLQKNLCSKCLKRIRYLIMSAKASIEKANDSMVSKPCCFIY